MTNRLNKHLGKAKETQKPYGQNIVQGGMVG